MSQPEIQLKRVHEKIVLLLKHYQALQKEHERLKEDLKKMQARCEIHYRRRGKIPSAGRSIQVVGQGYGRNRKKDA